MTRGSKRVSAGRDQPKVAHLDAPVHRKEDVTRLQVAMDKALQMHILHRLHYLLEDGHHLNNKLNTMKYLLKGVRRDRKNYICQPTAPRIKIHFCL